MSRCALSARLLRWGAIAAGTLALCRTAPVVDGYSHARYGGVVRVSVPEAVTSLDPSSCRDAADTVVFDLLFHRFFEKGPDGQPLSSLFEARREADRWVFVPRKMNATNGSRLGADEFRMCLQRGLARESFVTTLAREMIRGGSTFAPGTPLDAFVSEPDGSFALLTNGSQPLLPYVLSRPPFYLYVTADGQFYGNGPFGVASGQAAESELRLVANDGDPAGAPYVQQVIVDWAGASGEVAAEVEEPRGEAGIQRLTRGGFPLTLLLCLNRSTRLFSQVEARRNFIASVKPDRIRLPRGRGMATPGCAYLPVELGGASMVTALPPTSQAPLPAVRVMLRDGPFSAAVLAAAFPPGTEFDAVAPGEFETRRSSGDYQALLELYQHKFTHAALDLREMLSRLHLFDPAILDASNRASEAMLMEERALVVRTIQAAQKSLAESGLVFPLCEFTPAVKVDSRLHDLTVDRRWNLDLADCWIEAGNAVH
ncbi:MAG: hypothetical protein AB1714_27710 [Acidobacteriota bacterium]